MKKIYIRPKKGMIIRDPETLTPLPEEGFFVTQTNYWLRRLRDGDAEKVIPPQKKQKVKE